jgi:hypothetical protein
MNLDDLFFLEYTISFEIYCEEEIKLLAEISHIHFHLGEKCSFGFIASAALKIVVVILLLADTACPEELQLYIYFLIYHFISNCLIHSFI